MSKCINCGKPMKETLLKRNPRAKYCYTCWLVLIRKKFQKTKWYTDQNSKEKYAVTTRLVDIIKDNRKRYKFNRR